MAETAAPAAPSLDPSTGVQDRVLEIVRGLAGEVGGARALHAAAPRASLERDLGLGSLERVELLARLEAAFGLSLDDRFLALDTPADLAQALAETGGTSAGPGAGALERAPATSAAAPLTARAETMHEALWRRAEADPDRPHVYMREDDGTEHTITYGGLLRESRGVAGGLRERGVRPGETVALMLPTGLDFLRSFQGILMAGAIPVPIYPPVRLDRLEEYARRQSAILADAGVVTLITIARARPIASLLRPWVPSLAHVVTADELADLGALWPAPQGSATDAAFIQYTSGSTGEPKGVLLTHANLLANVRAIAAGLEAVPTDVGVSWLPLYHDMGLIGSWLFCLCQGLPIDIQSPLSFLARPERWLWAIHRRCATLSAAPNFAYELCVKKIPERALEGLDLSSWRCALNGAEPVNPETLDRFVKRFAPYGFRREAFLPVYGLAENSVAVCFPPVGRAPRIDRVARVPFEREGRALPAGEADRSALRFASEGRAVPEHEVMIVDAAGAAVPERTVGRLVFRGPSMTSGYYGKPQATAAVTLPGGWLDSGDLAYIADGEVHIAGRKKDLIIKAGRNLVPQEIEEVASQVQGIRKGCVAAFGVAQEAQGTEALVIVAETRVRETSRRDAMIGAITENVATAVGTPPDVVVLVPPGAVPKTSSGKIRRAATKEAYRAGELGAPPRTSLVSRLRLVSSAVWGEVRPRIGAALRVLYAAYLLLVLGGAALAVWPVIALVRGRHAARVLERLYVRFALRAAGCRMHVEGVEHIQGTGPFLLASNHTSYVDVAMLLALLPMHFVFVSKKEVTSWPFVGLFIRKAGHLTVDRDDAHDSVAAAGKVARAVEEGESVLVFPEATFTAASGLRPFRLGVFKTAVETGTPVVPLALRGARRALRDGTVIPRPGPLHLWIGAPIVPEGEGWRAVVRLRDRVADAIAAHCGEPRLDMVAGSHARP